MLEAVKLALQITAGAYDAELQSLIRAAILDLQAAGVTASRPADDNDDLVKRAVITYVRMHFGSPPDYDRLKASYDEQKGQLRISTGYTDWGDGAC